MKEFWSSRIQKMIPYTPGEQPRERRFIKLNTNENPYPPSLAVMEAIRQVSGESLRLYPDPEAVSLRESLAAYHDVKLEQIFVGNGSDEVLAFCFQAFYDCQNPVNFADVTYSFYQVYAEFYGIPYREIPLDEWFGVPLEPFLEADGGVVLANPNGPTGREMSLCDIREVIEAHKNEVVVVDEAYVDFGAHTAVDLIHKYPNLVVVRTFSKSRSLAGLRVGYAVADANLITALNCVKNSFNSYPLDRLALAGAEASIRDHVYFRATLVKIMNTRDWIATRLKKMGFTVCDSSANFLFVSHEKFPAKALLDGLRKKGILVRWWDKPRIDQYLRITVGTPDDMKALETALQSLLPPECLQEVVKEF